MYDMYSYLRWGKRKEREWIRRKEFLERKNKHNITSSALCSIRCTQSSSRKHGNDAYKNSNSNKQFKEHQATSAIRNSYIP